MDAYSISHTTPSRRGSSRIYQDLVACRKLSRSHSSGRIERLIMDCTQKLRAPLSSHRSRIGIVGGGISGLRCADVLLQHGFSVSIVEARAVLGGRACQTTLPNGYTVDLGPNWIHGTEHNPILDLANLTNTPTHTWAEKVNVFGEDGKIFEAGKSAHEVMWGIIVQAFKYSADNTVDIDPERSLHDYFNEKLQEMYPGDGEAKEQRKIIMQMAELWGAFVGSSFTTQSLKFFWLEECLDGENLFCAGTYKSILNLIATPAVSKAKIMLSTKVTCINSTAAKVTLHTENDMDLEFDEVVVTSPLGWLQKNKDVFHPSLPGRFSQAIDSIGYGSLEKVYVSFSKAFWLKEGAEPSKQFTGFTQWLSPMYARDTNIKQWTQEAVDLSTLPEPNSHPTLLFYLYGDQSLSMATDIQALSLEEEKQEYLRSFFQPYYSRLPYYDKASKDCTPLNCFATSWVTDELAGYGSYSTFRTGLKEGDKDIEIMREGLTGRGLWFAGEHTAPFVALGTVTGAYWSGEAVGNRLAEAYGALRRKPRIPDIQDIETREGIKEVNVREFADKGLEK